MRFFIFFYVSFKNVFCDNLAANFFLSFSELLAGSGGLMEALSVDLTFPSRGRCQTLWDNEVFQTHTSAHGGVHDPASAVAPLTGARLPLSSLQSLQSSFEGLAAPPLPPPPSGGLSPGLR